MVTIIVKTLEELQIVNRRYFNRLNIANRNIIVKLAKVNEQVSKGMVQSLGTYPGGGELINSIDTSALTGRYRIQVMASAPHAYEIEEGLKSPVFRTFAKYPKLRAWAETKLRFDPTQQGKTGIKVGGDGSRVHPQGLKFMYGGYKASVEESDGIIVTELRKLETGG